MKPWQTGNVTLLGDAVHNMPPVGGLGGNAALYDASRLCRALIAVDRGERDHAHREELRGRERCAVRGVLRHAALRQAVTPVEAEGETAEQDHHGEADDDEGLPTLVLAEATRVTLPWIHPTPLDRNPKFRSLAPGHKYRIVGCSECFLRRIG